MIHLRRILAIACLLVSGPLFAVDTYQLDIKPQPLNTALQQFAKQSGLQIVYYGKIAEGHDAAGISGNLTADQALKRLLAGTDLQYETLDQYTVAISSTKKTSADASQVSHLRLVQTDQPPSEMKKAKDSSESLENKEQEIVVTGSRLRHGGGQEPSPVTVFDREKIDKLGVSSVPDMLKYLPQQPFMRNDQATLSGEQYVQLRGLPTGGTVVLLNGRRTVVTNGNENGFDLNTIPLAAIERVEVLSGSASAVYGADAVGGVMNVVLKKDLTRPVVDLHYGSARGGGQERRASVASGYDSERWRASLLLDYSARDPLLGAERDLMSNRDYRRFGDVDYRSRNANPGTVASSTGANLPGLSSPFALAPQGSTGVGLTPADFLAVPTIEDLRVDSLGRFEALVMQRKSRAAAGFAELDLTGATSLFVQALYSDMEVITPRSPSGATLDVPADNPFNPFGVPLTVRYLFGGVGPRVSTLDKDMLSATAGLKGRLESWDWELSGLKTKSTSFYVQDVNTISTAQANCLLTNPATRTPGACDGITEVLNVFQDGAGGSPALLASLISAPEIFPSRTEATQFTAFLRGAAFSLPAGSAEAVVGASGGNEKWQTLKGRNSKAAFAELRVPLVSAAMRIPAVTSLSLKLAARYDDYSDFGQTFNPQYGLVWTPVADISFTGSYGTSFSPPTLFNLFRFRGTVGGVPTIDPHRNNETAFVDLTFGGNPRLGAEEGSSLTAGVVYSPHQLPRLRLSAHYWSVDLDDRTTFLSRAQVLANENRFASRLVRAAPTPADIAAGLPGVLLSIDTSAINAANLKISGVDWAADYTFDTRWGQFSPSLAATWTRSYKAQDFPDVAAQERVGLASFDGTIPKWKALGSLAWAQGGWGLSATARYAQGYDDMMFVAGQPAPNGRRVPPQTLIDMQASVNMDGFTTTTPLLQGMKLTIGATNLFDKEPPFVGFSTLGYDSSQADLIGRWVYANLSKTF